MAETASGEGGEGPRVPSRLVFRLPRITLLGVLAVMLFAIPFASGLPWLWLIYVVPLALGYLVVRLRTVADADGLVARGPVRTDRIPWEQLRSLRLAERSWVRAVRADGREVRLPTVRMRHLPALSLISGGRIVDPTEPPPAESQTAESPTAESPTAEPQTVEQSSGEQATADDRGAAGGGHPAGEA